MNYRQGGFRNSEKKMVFFYADKFSISHLLHLSVASLRRELSDLIKMLSIRVLKRVFYTRIYSSGLDPNRVLSDYISIYIDRDLRQLSLIHNLSLFERFLGLCAGRVGQILNFSSLANDTGISYTTASEWMTLLQAGTPLNSDYFRGLRYFLERVVNWNPYTVFAGFLVYAGDRGELRNDIYVTHPAEPSLFISVLEK